MNSILEEFANGNISPAPRYFKRDSPYGRALEELCDKEEALLARLNEEEKALFQAFEDSQMEVNSLSATSNFIYGYKLGLLLTAEAFFTKDDLLTGEAG